jgi:hypothetical protein
MAGLSRTIAPRKSLLGGASLARIFAFNRQKLRSLAGFRGPKPPGSSISLFSGAFLPKTLRQQLDVFSMFRCAIVHGNRGRYARFTIILIQRGGFSAMKNVFGNDIPE